MVLVRFINLHLGSAQILLWNEPEREREGVGRKQNKLQRNEMKFPYEKCMTNANAPIANCKAAGSAPAWLGLLRFCKQFCCCNARQEGRGGLTSGEIYGWLGMGIDQVQLLCRQAWRHLKEEGGDVKWLIKLSDWSTAGHFSYAINTHLEAKGIREPNIIDPLCALKPIIMP